MNFSSTLVATTKPLVKNKGNWDKEKKVDYIKLSFSTTILAQMKKEIILELKSEPFSYLCHKSDFFIWFITFSMLPLFFNFFIWIDLYF